MLLAFSSANHVFSIIYLSAINIRKGFRESPRISNSYNGKRKVISHLEFSTSLPRSKIICLISVFFTEILGTEFAEFLLELIENPPDTDLDEQIPDLFLTLLLAYNLQFENPVDNLLLNALENIDNAKTFCEKVLLLLNREGKFL